MFCPVGGTGRIAVDGAVGIGCVAQTCGRCRRGGTTGSRGGRSAEFTSDMERGDRTDKDVINGSGVNSISTGSVAVIRCGECDGVATFVI